MDGSGNYSGHQFLGFFTFCNSFSSQASWNIIISTHSVILRSVAYLLPTSEMSSMTYVMLLASFGIALVMTSLYLQKTIIHCY